MNAITPFVFESEHMVRAIDRDGDPWFVLADVCRVLDLSNPSMAAAPLDEDERSKLNLGRQGEAIIISESGLYALVLRCRGAMTAGTLPHRFRRWVTAEVLPTLRKTGRYDMGGAASPDALAADMLPRVSLVRECRLLHGRAAAQALWRDLGLPAPPAPPEPETSGGLPGLTEIERWWFTCLWRGGLREGAQWPCAAVPTADVFASYCAETDQKGHTPRAIQTRVGQALSRFLGTSFRRVRPLQSDSRRVPCVLLPSLATARARFEDHLHYAPHWPEPAA